MSLKFNLKDWIDETEMTNQHFLSILASVPPTFCIVLVPRKSALRNFVNNKPSLHRIRFRLNLQVPNEANATFASRKNDDSNYTVYTDDACLRFSDRSELYYLIISRLRQWQNDPLIWALEPETARPEAPASGVRLLSLDIPDVLSEAFVTDVYRWWRRQRALQPTCVRKAHVRD